MNRKEIEAKRIQDRLEAGKSVSLNKDEADELAEKLLSEADLKKIIKDLYPEAEFLTPDEALEAISKAENQLVADKYPLDELDVAEHTELLCETCIASHRQIAQMENRFKLTFGIGAEGNNKWEAEHD